MQVRMLRMSGTILCHYSSNVETAIKWLTGYPSTIIMEPGELADFAQGHNLLTNGLAKIVILQDNESVFISEGEYAYVTFPDAVVEPAYKEENHRVFYGRTIRRNLPPI